MSNPDVPTKEFGLFMGARQMYSDLFGQPYSGPWDPKFNAALTNVIPVLEAIAIGYFKQKCGFEYNQPAPHPRGQKGTTLFRYSQAIIVPGGVTPTVADAITKEFFETRAPEIFSASIIPAMSSSMGQRLINYTGSANVEDYVWGISSEQKSYTLPRLPFFSTTEYIVCVYARTQPYAHPNGATHTHTYLYYLGYYLDSSPVLLPPVGPIGIHGASVASIEESDPNTEERGISAKL